MSKSVSITADAAAKGEKEPLKKPPKPLNRAKSSMGSVYGQYGFTARINAKEEEAVEAEKITVDKVKDRWARHPDCH